MDGTRTDHLMYLYLSLVWGKAKQGDERRVTVSGSQYYHVYLIDIHLRLTQLIQFGTICVRGLYI